MGGATGDLIGLLPQGPEQAAVYYYAADEALRISSKLLSVSIKEIQRCSISKSENFFVNLCFLRRAEHR